MKSNIEKIITGLEEDILNAEPDTDKAYTIECHKEFMASYKVFMEALSIKDTLADY